jgi:hypothetical protein
MNKLIRGQNICRGCDSANVFEALNLGSLPIANELTKEINMGVEIFPLVLSICKDCGLGQLPEAVNSARLFEDYRYRSSVSSSFLKHGRDFVEEILEEYTFETTDYVLELASNDGYLLNFFRKKGIRVLGIEPARNIAAIALEEGIDTINAFFSNDLAERILKEFGYPRLIVANNVFAHVPDMQDFLRGIATLTNEKTIITIENPPLNNILEKLQFDTIYHEHFSYLSLNSVSKIANRSKLMLFKVKSIATHGGSIRFYLRLSDSLENQSKIERLLTEEIRSGLFEESSWEELKSKIDKITSDLNLWIRESNLKNKRVYGYGAAAKASTLLNLAKIEKKYLPAVADKSSEKTGRYMPCENLPIISVNELIDRSPDQILIFPWNIASEIVNELNDYLPNVEFWVCIPALKQVGQNA